MQEQDISLSIMNSKHAFTCFSLVHIISPKHRSTLNAHANDFECRHIEHVMPHKQGIPSGIIVRGEGGATPFFPQLLPHKFFIQLLGLHHYTLELDVDPSLLMDYFEPSILLLGM